MSLATASAAVRCSATGCTGYIEPTTNNAGMVIDRPCPECERRRSKLVRKRIEYCTVDGCPGRVHVGFDIRGVRWVTVPCPFCERRAKWDAHAREHGVPDPACLICEAEIPMREGPGRQDIYCAVCKPIVRRAHWRDERREEESKEKTRPSSSRPPPGPHLKVSSSDRLERNRAIIERYIAGGELSDIAPAFGLTAERCRQVLQAAGVPRRRRRA